jgi:ATP-dependent Clp protease ATP-binding subunit ClpX
MIRILREPKNAILRQFEYMFEVEGTELRFEDGALNAIAKEAIEKGTGARGLRSICERILRDIMFELPDMEGVKAVVITEDTVVKRTDPVIIEKADEPDGTEKVKQLMGGAAEKVKETAEALMKKDKETAKAAAEE